MQIRMRELYDYEGEVCACVRISVCERESMCGCCEILKKNTNLIMNYGAPTSMNEYTRIAILLTMLIMSVHYSYSLCMCVLVVWIAKPKQ